MFIPQAFHLRKPIGDLTTANCSPKSSIFITAIRNECVCNAQEVKTVLEHQAAEELEQGKQTKRDS